MSYFKQTGSEQITATAIIDKNQKLPKAIRRELRGSHAGELGAVWIYRGILCVSRNKQVREFAKTHLQTEKKHLEIFESIIHFYRGSLLLPIWILAGFLTGFLPALFSKNAVFKTIEAVETFVDLHYQRQIELIKQHPELHLLAMSLRHCQQDEIEHKQQAADLSRDVNLCTGKVLRAWCQLVRKGSAVAVLLAKRI